MYAQTIVSFLHWARFQDGFCLILDILMSGTILFGHLYISWSDSGLFEMRGTGWCAACIGAYFCKKMFWDPGNKNRPMKEYHVSHLFPHATFRFCGFWTAMVADGQEFDPLLSAFYWMSIVLCGMPLPGETLETCKGGWKQYLGISGYFHPSIKQKK